MRHRVALWVAHWSVSLGRRVTDWRTGFRKGSCRALQSGTAQRIRARRHPSRRARGEATGVAPLPAAQCGAPGGRTRPPLGGVTGPRRHPDGEVRVGAAEAPSGERRRRQFAGPMCPTHAVGLAKPRSGSTKLRVRGSYPSRRRILTEFQVPRGAIASFSGADCFT